MTPEQLVDLSSADILDGLQRGEALTVTRRWFGGLVQIRRTGDDVRMDDVGIEFRLFGPFWLRAARFKRSA